MKARLPCTVSVPIELPGASVPPLMVVLPTVPVPPSVPPAFTVVVEMSDRAVHRQRAAVDVVLPVKVLFAVRLVMPASTSTVPGPTPDQ